MNIGKAFSYVFEDERWVSKVALGGVLLLIPFLGWFVALGLMVKVARNVAQGNPRPIPEPFADFGDNLKVGFFAFLSVFVYALPAMIVYFVLLLIVGLLSGNGDSASGVAVLFSCIANILYYVLLLGGYLFGLAALARYVSTDTLSEAFKFDSVIATVRAKPGPWLMLLLVAFLANIVGGVGTIACFIGVIFTTFYAVLVQGHALGQTMVAQGMGGGATYGGSVPPRYDPPRYDPPSTPPPAI